jgi:hypothetical protein
MGSEELPRGIAAVMGEEAPGVAEDLGFHAASAIPAKEEIGTMCMRRGMGGHSPRLGPPRISGRSLCVRYATRNGSGARRAARLPAARPHPGGRNDWHDWFNRRAAERDEDEVGAGSDPPG